MKFLATIVTLLAWSSSPAFAIKVWQGDLFIVTVTPACQSAGINSNTYYRGVFKPQNLEDNGPDSKLALFAAANGHSYIFKNAAWNLGRGPYTGVIVTSIPKIVRFAGTFEITRIMPTPTSATKALVFRIVMNNFANHTGCTIRLEGSLGNNPEF